MLVVSNVWWLSVKDQVSWYKAAQKEGKRGQAYGILLCQKQRICVFFPPHNIQRTIHYAQWKTRIPYHHYHPQKTYLPCCCSLTFRKERGGRVDGSGHRKLWTKMLRMQEEKKELLSDPCECLPEVWGCDVNGNHISHKAVRNAGSSLKFKGFLLSHLLKIYQVVSSWPNFSLEVYLELQSFNNDELNSHSIFSALYAWSFNSFSTFLSFIRIQLSSQPSGDKAKKEKKTHTQNQVFLTVRMRDGWTTESNLVN